MNIQPIHPSTTNDATCSVWGAGLTRRTFGFSRPTRRTFLKFRSHFR